MLGIIVYGIHPWYNIIKTERNMSIEKLFWRKLTLKVGGKILLKIFLTRRQQGRGGGCSHLLLYEMTKVVECVDHLGYMTREFSRCKRKNYCLSYDEHKHKQLNKKALFGCRENRAFCRVCYSLWTERKSAEGLKVGFESQNKDCYRGTTELVEFFRLKGELTPVKMRCLS
jgi:hypothetical protein